jgi:putative SOS response-associated peptidase YedK
MCYDVKAKLESQLKRAKRKNDFVWIAELEEKLKPYNDEPIYRASGFDHPSLLIYEEKEPNKPVLAQWGLVPNWIKNDSEKEKIWNNTLNARVESIFEKPSFKESANTQKCLIQIDGFFEHHYRNNKPFPYYISRKDNEPITIAGLASDWLNLVTGKTHKTFSIVTTKANGLLAEIHNSPKLIEPRIPLLLTEQQEDFWLNETTEDTINQISESKLEDKLKGHLVAPIRGKKNLGNTKEVTDEYIYEEFNTLF